MGSSQPVGSKNEQRVGYDSKTHAFSTLKSGQKEKLAKLKTLQTRVSTLKIPVDSTSPSYLQTLSMKMDHKAEHIDQSTDGVLKYLSGDSSFYGDFIAGLRQVPA